MAPARPRHGRWLVPAVVVLVVAAGAVGVSALSADDDVRGTTDDRPTTTTNEPADPLGPDLPRVRKLEVTRQQDKVVAAWRNRSSEPGDSYLYRLVDPADPRPYEGPITETSVTVAAPAGRQCVEVQLVRANGQPSEAVTACTSR